MKSVSVFSLALLFGATVPAHATQRSFDEAIREILAKGTAIALERAHLSSIKSRNMRTRLALLPTVSANAFVKRSHSNSRDTDTRGGELETNLNLFRWGADHQAWKAAQAEESSTESSVESAQIRAEIEGARALLNWISRGQQAGVLERTVEMQKRTLLIARERFGRGLLPEQEVEKLTIDAEIAKSRHSDAVASEATARARARALADDPELMIALEWPWKEILSKTSKNVSPAVELASRRPDVRAAALFVETQARKANQAWRTLLPRLDASGTYGTTKTLRSGTGFSNYWTGQLTLSINLFDRWSGIGDAEIAARDREISELRLSQLLRDARADLESSVGTLRQALESAEVRDRTSSTSRRLFEDAQRRFQAGRSSANELTTEQSRLDEADLLAIRGWESAHIAMAEFCLAQGQRVLTCVTATSD